MMKFSREWNLRAASLFVLSCAPLLFSATEVSGPLGKLDADQGAGAAYKLVGDATLDWSVKPYAWDLDINGHTFTMETGGGNKTVFSGVISGTGQFHWNGGGNGSWQTVPSFLSGDRANTFSGTLTVLRGMLALAKPAGVDTIAGDLVLGGGSNQAIVRLDAANQIKDTCNLLITGEHEGRLWTQGFDETLGTLDLQSHGYIDLGDGSSRLVFADSSALTWDLTKTLTIQNWTPGKDSLSFGTGGLTRQQLARIGFDDPAGKGYGLYTAGMRPDGSLAPARRVKPVNPPFDMSPKAYAARQAIYKVNGLANLSGKDTPLKAGMRISFFGDSITWQNQFISKIEASLKSGTGSSQLDVKLLNHGINGGGVLQIRDGAEKSAYVDATNKDGRQLPFAEVIAADRSDVAVVFIGINDVWWRKTSPADFAAALRGIAAAAKENETALVLATLTVYQEKPDGSNPMDDPCDQFADITRKAAGQLSVTLVDLRNVFVAYLQNHNAELRVDGSLHFLETGILTYDGVHPTDMGNDLLAEHLAQGIYKAITQ